MYVTSILNGLDDFLSASPFEKNGFLRVLSDLATQRCHLTLMCQNNTCVAPLYYISALADPVYVLYIGEGIG